MVEGRTEGRLKSQGRWDNRKGRKVGFGVRFGGAAPKDAPEEADTRKFWVAVEIAWFLSQFERRGCLACNVGIAWFLVSLAGESWFFDSDCRDKEGWGPGDRQKPPDDRGLVVPMSTQSP